MDRRAFPPADHAGPPLRRVLALTLAAVAFSASVAAAVSLSSSFGSHGIVKLNSAQINGLATQKDGSVVAGGSSGSNMLVLRITSRGRTGRPLNAGRGVANAVAVQSDGKIVVAGRSSSGGLGSNGQMIVRRFNKSGSPDRRFGSGGTARIGGAVANAVAIGPGGTIVAAGYAIASDGVPRLTVARFRSNGSPDRLFGHGGLAIIDLGRFSEANGVAVQRDGKVVVAGDQRPDLRVTNALVARLTSHGSLDRGFAHSGAYLYFHPRGGAASSFGGVALDRSGRIVAAGGDVQNSGPHALFVRLGGSGRLDRGFGGGVITPVSAVSFNPGSIIGATGVVISRRGQIYGTGQYSDAGQGEIAVWPISSSGRVGRLSRSTIPGTLGGSAKASALASDGHIYVGGNVVSFTSNNRGFVARFNG